MAVVRITTPKPEQRRRMELCRACEFAQGPGDRKIFCGKCGCVLAGMTRIQGEKCPVGKW